MHDSDPSSNFDIIVHNDRNINYNSTVKRAVTVMADGKTVKLGQKIGDMFIVQITDASGTKMVQLPYDGVPRISEVNMKSPIATSYYYNFHISTLSSVLILDS